MEKLLFIGSDSCTRYAVEYARRIKVFTIATDYIPYESSAFKHMTDAYWDIDIKDLDKLEPRCRKEGITAVFAGNNELCLDSARELCRRLGLPFYASDKGWETARDKKAYKEACRRAGLSVPAEYRVRESVSELEGADIHFPVIVKPVDCCGQAGLSKCDDMEMLRAGYEKAMACSPGKNIVIEDYIYGIETDAFIYICENEARLVYLSDKCNMFVNGEWKCSLQPCRSRFHDEYVSNEMPKLRLLFRDLGITDGAVCVQSIIKDGVFYHLEICYRIDGIGSWSNAKRMFGFSNVEWMVDYARGVRHTAEELKSFDFENKDKYAASYLFWSAGGEIAEIKGLDRVMDMPDVDVVYRRFRVGDTVPANGTMRQMAYYISIVADSLSGLKRDVAEINRTLQHFNKKGEAMLLPFEDLDAVDVSFG